MTVAGDLLVKVVGAFVTDGLKRAYHEVRAGIRRRQVLDKVLSNVSTTDDGRLKRAFGDLNILIGTVRGELTESVAAFIREIERSALPEVMVRSALTHGDPKSIYPPFEVIYTSFEATLPFPCQAFFNAFYNAIKLSLEAEVKDPGLLEFVQAQHTEISRQLTDVSKALSAIQQLPQPLKYREISEARIKLARSLEAANRYLSVETLKGVKRCRIRQLVVPPRLATSSTAKFEIKKAKAHPKEIDFVSYITFRSTARRAVILGDPGGGKSTLTQMLCYDNSYSIMLEANYPGKSQIDPTSLRLPLRIILRSFDKRRQSSGLGLFDHLVDQIKEVFESDVNQTSRILRHLLTMGNAIIIFDGLDEILEIERRREIVALIEQFTNVYAACPTIITSRLVGYQDAPMNDDYSIYYLSTFSSDEVALFSHKFIKFVEGIKSQEAKDKSKIFLLQTDNIATDLRENPLMLGLMVYLFIYRGDVPSNRPEIYKECATLMFEKWDQRRDIIFKIPVDFDLLDLFSFLASKIFGSAQTEDGVSGEWITAQLKLFFENWYLDKAKALQAAKSLVEFITGRAWVMFEVGPNVYKFTHRTFLEYFFARNLLSSSESVGALFKTHLLERILKSEWDVVCHLALQTAVFRDSGKMTQAADTIMSAMQSGTFPARQEMALLRFVASSLEYLMLSETRYCDLISLLCQRTIAVGAKGEIEANSILNLTIHNTRKREGLAKNVIYRTFRDAVKGDDGMMRSFSMLAIARNPLSESSRRFGGNFLGTTKWLHARSNGNYFYELRKETEALNFSLAEVSSIDSLAFIFAYNDRHLDLFNRHRWKAFYSELPHPIWDNASNILLDTLEFYIVREEMQSRRGKSELLSALDGNWELVTKLSNDLISKNMPKFVQFKFTPHPWVLQEIEEIIRLVYLRLTGRGSAKRHKDDGDRCAKLLLLVAFAIESLEGRGEKRQSAKREPRFEPFIPSGPLERVLHFIGENELVPILSDWNKWKITLKPQ